MARRILHLDLDAFFCAVEEQRDPTLSGLPFAVGGSPEGRGVVASCSYAARKMGIRSAMPMKLAIRLCPSLKIVSSGYHLYSQASKQVMDIMHSKAPHMEQISIDEAFLDISDLPESSEGFARQLQSEIREVVYSQSVSLQ
jgi:DNA polymerase-4